MKFGVGQPVRRTEDNRFITRRGRYTDDLRFAGETRVDFTRSPHAYAHILSIDVEEAGKAPGVIAVLTHDDVDAVGAGPMPCVAPVGRAKMSPKALLAKDRVTFSGEAIGKTHIDMPATPERVWRAINAKDAVFS